MDPFHVDSSSKESILASFDNIADKLLNKYLIKSNASYFRPVEIEFYFKKIGIFEDTYIHGHDKQLTNGQWYFHYSGFDLTIGDGTNYGGILIRGLRRLGEKDEFICGPLKILNTLLNEYTGVFDQNNSFLQLLPVSEKTLIFPEKIEKSPRIGLASPDASNKYNKHNMEFKTVEVRYTIFNNEVSKYLSKKQVEEMNWKG